MSNRSDLGVHYSNAAGSDKGTEAIGPSPLYFELYEQFCISYPLFIERFIQIVYSLS